MITPEQIADAKARLPITKQWAMFQLPGKPGKSCKSPFRQEKHPSFSIYNEGRRAKDFSTGEVFDEIAFFERATGLPPGDAFKQFLATAGGASYVFPAQQQRPAPAPPPRQRPSFPELERGTDEDLHAVAKLRNLSFNSLKIARDVALLRFAELKGHRSFIATDETRLNAQARRLDGEPWEHIGAKAWTLPGSWAAWPIGIELLALESTPPAILICEGGPDLLAALHFIHGTGEACRWLPCAMLGASLAIHEDALPRFAGHRCRIYPHADEAGRKSAARWTQQLQSIGAEVDCFDFSGLRKMDGSPVGDLNDAASIHPEDAAELEGLLP